MSDSACSTLVIHCIDFRFAKAIKEYLEAQGLLGDCDIVSDAGAARNIAAPAAASDREFLLRQVGISVRLHGIKDVLLINHEDCGAYGRQAFPSPESEQAAHVADLAAAAKIIRESYPTLTIRKVLAAMSEDGRISFKEIA